MYQNQPDLLRKAVLQVTAVAIEVKRTVPWGDFFSTPRRRLRYSPFSPHSRAQSRDRVNLTLSKRQKIARWLNFEHHGPATGNTCRTASGQQFHGEISLAGIRLACRHYVIMPTTYPVLGSNGTLVTRAQSPITGARNACKRFRAFDGNQAFINKNNTLTTLRLLCKRRKSI